MCGRYATTRTPDELADEFGAQVADAATLLSSDLAAGMTATFANATGGALID